MERIKLGKTDTIVLLILIILTFAVNHHIELKGLYMDDLYLWSTYGEQGFLEYIFPVGSTRFRFVYYLIAWIEMTLVGSNVSMFLTINLMANIGLGFTLYKMAQAMSHSSYVSGICASVFLLSRMSYYQISQVYGLMETVALFLALCILYFLYQYLTQKEVKGWNRYFLACSLYFVICFVHERYMVLFPLFILVAVLRKEKRICYYASAFGVLLAILFVRYITIGTLEPAGTGGTEVMDTVSITSIMTYVMEQIGYLFGLNLGPEHLNGENIANTPIMIVICIGAANVLLLLFVISFIVRMIQVKEIRKQGWMVATLFICFIGGCILSSSVTIRVELRWVYVSFGAALLFVAWMYGIMVEGMVEKGRWIMAFPYLIMLTLYGAFMIPVELHYRNQYEHVYLWPNQARYNSLAEETYGRYGDEIFDKTIYIVGNTYEMSEFTANTFFKVFDKEGKAEGLQVIHIDDIREIGLVKPDMLVLREDPKYNGFQDITQAARSMKLNSVYGYYEDGWMEEEAEIQVMAGASGIVQMDFYYPGQSSGEQWIYVYQEQKPVAFIQIEDNKASTQIIANPNELITLKICTNFYFEDAIEKRGDRNLATILEVTAN